MDKADLKPGDTLTLRYTLAYGWDIGNGQGRGNSVGYCVTIRRRALVRRTAPRSASCYNGRYNETDLQALWFGESLYAPEGSPEVRRSGERNLCAGLRGLREEPLVTPRRMCFNTRAKKIPRYTSSHASTTADTKKEEPHIWKEISNTANCEHGGIRTDECRDCHAKRGDRRT